MIFAVDEAFKVRKKATVRNRYNQVTHLTQDTIWESDKITRKHYMQESQEPALSQQVTTRLQETDVTKGKDKHTKKIHERSSTLERSVRKLLEGLN